MSEFKSLVVYSRQVSKFQDAENKKFNNFTSILQFLHQLFKIFFARTFFWKSLKATLVKEFANFFHQTMKFSKTENWIC